MTNPVNNRSVRQMLEFSPERASHTANAVTSFNKALDGASSVLTGELVGALRRDVVRMGVWDRFCDLFRSTRKADLLEHVVRLIVMSGAVARGIPEKDVIDALNLPQYRSSREMAAESINWLVEHAEDRSLTQDMTFCSSPDGHLELGGKTFSGTIGFAPDLPVLGGVTVTASDVCVSHHVARFALEKAARERLRFVQDRADLPVADVCGELHRTIEEFRNADCNDGLKVALELAGPLYGRAGRHMEATAAYLMLIHLYAGDTRTRDKVADIRMLAAAALESGGAPLAAAQEYCRAADVYFGNGGKDEQVANARTFAAAAFEASGKPMEAAREYGKVADLCMKRGHREEAAYLYEYAARNFVAAADAVAGKPGADNMVMRGRAYHEAARCYMNVGDHASAAALFWQAAESFGAVAADKGQPSLPDLDLDLARTYEGAGDALRNLNEPEEAARADACAADYRARAQNLEEAGHPREKNATPVTGKEPGRRSPR